MLRTCLCTAFVALCLSIATTANAAQIFGATYDSSKAAELAAGSPTPVVGGLATINTSSSKFGAGSLSTSTVTSGNNGVKYSTSGNFNPLAGTVDFWMQLPNGYNDQRQDLFSIFAGGYTGDFSLYIDPSNDRLRTIVDVNGANQWQQVGYANANTVLGDGNWHHIAWEWDTVLGWATMYVDGVPENYSVSGTVSFAGGTLGTTFEVGSRQGGYDPFLGNIDDFRIFDTAIYGQASFTPPTQSFNVPEPASAAMMLAATTLLLIRRNR
jgi:hypothetical protein